jgi:hypothetical protein
LRTVGGSFQHVSTDALYEILSKIGLKNGEKPLATPVLVGYNTLAADLPAASLCTGGHDEPH